MTRKTEDWLVANSGWVCVVILALAFLLGFGFGRASAHDGQHDDWYANLRDSAGRSCCDKTDCAPTDWRVGRGGEFEVPINGQWTPVPADTVLWRKDNPTGRAVLCYRQGQIRCFVPGILI